ncbi:hypothetical protein CBM2606_A60127 [Cupriavidus taiwanensis]|nr:hypothetical protein CBM2606_A60127 [Cupriavidus taiwanensis]
MKSYISRKLPLTTRNTVRNPCCEPADAAVVSDMAVSQAPPVRSGGMMVGRYQPGARAAPCGRGVAAGLMTGASVRRAPVIALSNAFQLAISGCRKPVSAPLRRAGSTR